MEAFLPTLGPPQCLGERDERALSQSQFKAMCDMTASEAGAVIGLDPNESRKRWLERRLGLAPPKSTLTEDAVARLLLELGRREQPLAEKEYLACPELFDSENETFTGEQRWIRRVDSFVLGATPDMMILDKSTQQPKRLVEIKTVQYSHPDSDELRVKNGDLLKWHHVAQCMVQMFCTAVNTADLFYYRASTGRFWCYRLSSHDRRFVVLFERWLKAPLLVKTPEEFRSFPKRLEKKEIHARKLALAECFSLWTWPAVQ